VRAAIEALELLEDSIAHRHAIGFAATALRLEVGVE
jgi:hypothetical protein